MANKNRLAKISLMIELIEWTLHWLKKKQREI